MTAKPVNTCTMYISNVQCKYMYMYIQTNVYVSTIDVQWNVRVKVWRIGY